MAESITPYKSKLLVIVPIYNAEKTIVRALTSVKALNVNTFVLLVDDGSSDGTREILKLKNVSNLYDKIIFFSRSYGVSHARNAGIAWASQFDFKFLTFLDSDDHFISSELKLPRRNHKSSLQVYDSFETLDSYENYREYKNFIKKKNASPSNDLLDVIKNYRLTPNQVSVFTSVWGKIFDFGLIRKEKIRFNEKMDTFEDVDFNFRYLSYGKSVSFFSDTIYVHTNPKDRSSTASFASGKNFSKLFSFIWAIRSLEKFVKETYGIQALNFDHLRAAYFSISFMRAGRKVDSFVSFLSLYRFLRKRVRKILTIGYFEDYDVSEAGGRKILSWLVKRNYAFGLAIYISTVGAFEKYREGRKWAK